MRLMLLSLFVIPAMLASACGEDGDKPVPDMSAADVAVPDAAIPDVELPDQALPDVERPDQAAPDTVPHFDFTVPTCPFEVNLASKTPCMCGSTVVYDVTVQYPECTSPQVVKCCPLDGAPKCE